MGTFLFVVVLLCAVAASESAITLSHPVLVTDNQAVRIDIKTETLMHHARVTRVIACSAIDRPFLEYTETRAVSTGCDSPGFTAVVIYSDHGQTEVNKFLVRQTAQSLYVRRRLLNRYSPVVYLQIYIRLVNNVGASETEHVFNTRFEYPERSLPLGGADLGTAEKQEDDGHHIPTMTDGMDEAEEILGDHSESYNGKGRHWSEYVAIAGGVAAMLLAFALIAYMRRDELVRRRLAWRQAGTQSSYSDRRSKTERDTILGWLGAAYDRGIVADRRNRP